MKKFNIIIATVLLLVSASCKKDKDVIKSGPVPPTPIDTIAPPPVGDTVHIPLDDTARFLLKDIVNSGLPSPYYHFEYDNMKYVNKISFAANFDIYNVEYANKRVSKTTNPNNGHQQIYTYENGKVSLITESSVFNGQILWKYYFKYNVLNQLEQIKWQQFRTPTDIVDYRKLILQYRADGNLAKTDDFMIDPNDHLIWSKTTEYKDYDNTLNVDDFALFKNFFESMLFVPGVKFQTNNHHTEVITGAQNDYRVTYTYQLTNGLPVRKNGNMVQTRGTNSGQSMNFTSQLSYY
ncbi:MAG: hypothetical protein QM737_20960 [Ferruginibacter sp.]